MRVVSVSLCGFLGILFHAVSQDVSISNPREIATTYAAALYEEKSFVLAYEYLADATKQRVSKLAYVDHYESLPDFVANEYELVDLEDISPDAFTEYKRFALHLVHKKSDAVAVQSVQAEEVREEAEEEEDVFSFFDDLEQELASWTPEADTQEPLQGGVTSYHYLTLRKHYNEWQVVWVADLVRKATDFLLAADFDSAYAVCDDALYLDEYESELYRLMAWGDLRADYVDDLPYYVEEALKYGPKDPAVLTLAAILQPEDVPITAAMGYYEEALVLATTNEERATLYANMGYTYVEYEDYAKAQEMSEKATTLAANGPHGYYVGALAHMGAGDFQQALLLLERAASLPPVADTFLQSTLYYDYADVLAYETEEAFRKDLDGNTYNVNDAARKYATLALSLEPWNGYYEEMLEALGNYQQGLSLPAPSQFVEQAPPVNDDETFEEEEDLDGYLDLLDSFIQEGSEPVPAAEEEQDF